MKTPCKLKDRPINLNDNRSHLQWQPCPRLFSPGGPVTILALVLTLIKDLLERKEEDETVF
jgi:hypothetical protein